MFFKVFLRAIVVAAAFTTVSLATSCPKPPGGYVTSISTPVLDFSAAKWIWTPEESPTNVTAPIGVRAFRKDFLAPYGKYPVCSTIVIAADNNYTLYVNGKPIGSGTSFTQAQVYTASLDFTLPNVFAILAGNTGGPAGLIGTFLITYSDGTTDTFVTDSSWRTFVGNAGPEATGPLVLDELPPWVDAVEIASNGQLAIWPPVTIPSALGGAYQRSNWIYPAEGNPTVSEPGGISRALRKTIDAPGPYGCKCGTCAQVVISADDEYVLYMNGKQVGSGTGFNTPQYYTITGLEGFSEVFAINTTNVPPQTPAAVIAAILIAYDDGTSNITSTDGSWKALPGTAPPAGFQDVNFNDASWPAAEALGTYGIAPWGTFPIPQA